MTNPTDQRDDGASALRLILAQIETQLELQERQRDTVTQKALALLAAALTFSSVVTLPMPTSAPAQPWLQGNFVGAWLLYALSCLSLLGSVSAAVTSVWPRRYARDPLPRALAERYHATAEVDVLRQLISNLAENFERNRPAIAGQMLQLKLSLLGLILGLLLFLVLVLVRLPLVASLR